MSRHESFYTITADGVGWRFQIRIASPVHDRTASCWGKLPFGGLGGRLRRFSSEISCLLSNDGQRPGPVDYTRPTVKLGLTPFYQHTFKNSCAGKVFIFPCLFISFPPWLRNWLVRLVGRFSPFIPFVFIATAFLGFGPH